MTPAARYMRFHLAMMATWVVLIVPTLIWLRQSVLWVAFLSLYANWATHFGAWNAARAEKKAEPDAEAGPLPAVDG